MAGQLRDGDSELTGALQKSKKLQNLRVPLAHPCCHKADHCICLGAILGLSWQRTQTRLHGGDYPHHGDIWVYMFTPGLWRLKDHRFGMIRRRATGPGLAA